MKFCKDNWEDIRRYFDKSYMKFPFFGDEVMFVDRVDAHGIYGSQLNSTDTDGWTFTFGLGGNEPEMEFILPKKSFFEYEGGVYQLSRTPSKQYKRGICVDNTTILMLVGRAFITVPLSLKLINAYTHKPNFQGFRLDSDGGYVVSKRMAVDNTGILYVDSHKIGYVYAETKNIVCSSALFFPEIAQILRSHGQEDFKLTVKKQTPKRKAQ